MNYIILDLEWDSVYFPPKKQFINQILQIGAVKTDENFDITDTFEVTVRSAISNRVTGRFAKLTGITNEVMRDGIPFEEAVRRFNEWTGVDFITMTWSDSDLYTIKNNEELLLPEGLRFSIGRYLDLQKFIQGEMRFSGYTDKNQISLAAAAEFFGISAENLSLHTAKDDSVLSAALLKKCYQKERFESYLRDTADPEFYKRMRFKPYPISKLDDPLIDKDQLVFLCDVCGAKAQAVTAWRYRNRWFAARFRCTQCGRKFLGRISFRKNYDDVTIKKKITELKPKKPKEEKTNAVQSVPEKV